MEVRTRFKGLDLIDRVPDELWNEVRDIVQETGIKTIPMEKKCSLGICNFLEEISSLSHSVVFLYFFTMIAEEGFVISSCYSLELCIQMFMSFLFSFAFCFSSFHSYL